MIPSSSVKVVVVGAGLAGLSAASTLMKAGFQHIQVLEAMSRPGGRVHTTRPFGQDVIELGANWIHGQEGNPLFQLAQEQGLLLEESGSAKTMCLPGSVTPRDYFFEESGRKLPMDQVDQVCAFFSKLTSRAFSSELDPKHSTQSLGGYLDQEFAQSLQATSKVGQRLFEWCKRSECTDEASSSLYEVSAVQLCHYVALEGGFFNSLGPGGYQALVDTLLDSLPPGTVLCDRPVRSIRWALEGESHAHPVSVLCQAGQCFTADHVIVTVPLGFLKENGAAMFEPALPTSKASAIERLGFGTVDKIYLRFEKRFWPDDCAGIQLVWDAGPEDEKVYQHSQSEGGAWRDTWYKKICGFDTVARHPTVLCGWITGREAQHMETLDERMVGEVCVRLLRSFTGWSVEEPAQVLMSKWWSEPFVRGSYTYPPPGVDAVREHNALAAPLPQPSDAGHSQEKPLQVLFAGEATHVSFYTTTHGAYITGIREAQRIIELYGDKKLDS
ncbi:peroxisomal N(1)-acetyl-spermine/spermidine oxidase isoform X2 [Esox lucius]|uniref:Amine oxidase n=2 Tax=Esox lucius TaxID=8010 RepID=A0A3P9A1P8_ESOLU|nr:peroxisomal N(1)-acetyl-spermine/spermidine oxidase isoform X2 [Esox lucius]XP_010878139.1 peroxisomal N(1)-acetyl-spermine/spermidine oxidase isoform X2 [Esox lucius]